MSHISLQIKDSGRLPYAEAYALQVAERDRLIHARDEVGKGGEWGGERGGGMEEGLAGGGMTLILVEHDPPVVTVSRKRGVREHLVADADRLASLGIEVCETDRGGDITYHGPGQIVAYPILDLRRLGIGVREYMRLLEEVVIRTIARFGMEGMRDGSATGVWVARDGVVGGAKISAMGVRVVRWVTMHGLALNVSTDLSHFETIVPCGLAGRPVTSMANELGASAPSIEDVRAILVEQMTQAVADPASFLSD